MPNPSQLAHTYYIVKGPYLIVENPDPPQAPQLEAEVPGFALDPLHVPHTSILEKVIVF